MTDEQQVQQALKEKHRNELLESLKSLGDYGHELAGYTERAWAVEDSGDFNPNPPTPAEKYVQALAENKRRAEEGRSA